MTQRSVPSGPSVSALTRRSSHLVLIRHSPSARSSEAVDEAVTTPAADPVNARAWIAGEVVAGGEDDRRMARETAAAVLVATLRRRGASWMILLRRPRRRSGLQGSPLANGSMLGNYDYLNQLGRGSKTERTRFYSLFLFNSSIS